MDVAEVVRGPEVAAIVSERHSGRRDGWSGRLFGVAAFVGRTAIALGSAALAEWAGLTWWIAVPIALSVWWWMTKSGVVGRRREPRLWVRVAAPAVLVVLTAASWSYTSYLTAPGYAPFDVRNADWLRDHGFDPVVDAAEYWLYGRHAPEHGPVALHRLPDLPPPVPAATVSSRVAPATPAPPDPIAGLLDDSLKGEGQWKAAGQSVDGVAVIHTTYFRPDPSASSVLATAAWVDQELTRIAYVPGTQEPEGAPWAWGSEVPDEFRASLVAAFNSGFRFSHIPGGTLIEGREPKPLVDGQASLMIDRDGRAHVGEWGEAPFVLGDHVIAVRQSLALIVERGRPVPGLMDSGRGDWGRRKWQLRYTRRSAVGVTAAGALVYVSGNQMTLGILADALTKAGAVTGMQLDIHHRHPTFNIYQPAAHADGVHGAKLDPSMAQSANRYLAPDQRDFFAVFVR